MKPKKTVYLSLPISHPQSLFGNEKMNSNEPLRKRFLPLISRMRFLVNILDFLNGKMSV
jgi:hypothetical protein